jgi:diaminopimelate epimerase
MILAQRVSNRNFGIGSDGLILIMPSSQADLKMRMFNPDGSEGEMCGNGIRCVAKYAYDHGLVDRLQIEIETGNGVLPLELFAGESGRVERVKVNMGPPKLNRGDLPMIGPADGQAIAVKLLLEQGEVEVTCVSMGNPHCVIFVDDVENCQLETLGPLIENHAWFPNRINVEFVQVVSRNEVIQRTWERGAGETLACGTGASAVTVAGVLNGYTERQIVNHLRGGDLQLEWQEGGPVMMIGPAVEVFSGEFNPR